MRTQELTPPDKEIVATIRRALADRIGEERYDLWFAATARFDVAGDRLTVAVKTAFVQDWLRTHFRKALEETARESLGPSAEVAFAVDADFVARRTADAAASSAGASTASSRSLTAEAPSNATAHTDGSLVEEPTVDAAPALRLVRNEAEAASVEPRSRRAVAPRRPHEFDEFVVGPSNRLAYTAALDVTEQLGRISPLLLCGPTGVGKTHLLEAVVAAARRRNDDLRTAFLTAEQFTTEFLEALHGKGLPNFRRKFRDLHLLVIDDLHFLEGKRATLVEFVHTLDVLQRAGRQVIVTADRPPEDLGFLGPEIRTRLSGGLICRLDTPDFATRAGIVARMGAKLGLNLSSEVRDFIATHFSAHARELAGAVKRLVVAVRAYDRPLDLPLAEEVLDELLRHRRKAVKLVDIQKAVCNVFGLEADALQSNRKGQDVSRPRMLAMWLARKHTRAALSEIGGFFGGRSHSTVISAHKKVDAMLDAREPLRTVTGRRSLDEVLRSVEETLLAG